MKEENQRKNEEKKKKNWRREGQQNRAGGGGGAGGDGGRRRGCDDRPVFKAQTDMDLNLLPNRGPAEDLPGSSLSVDRSVAILYQMIEEDDGFPT
ncbi:unnamed protein product [Camellia sinensis]